MYFRFFFILLASLFLWGCSMDEDVPGDAGGLLGETFQIVVLPHHGITGKKLDEFYTFLKQEYTQFDRIVIVSPEHYGLMKHTVESLPIGISGMCHNGACVKASTILPYGENSETGRVFSSSGTTKEHGLGEHIRRIETFFPEATVSPLLLRRKMEVNHEESDIAQNLSQLSDERILIIVSVDFSHHVREEFARLHDMKSIDVLRHGGIDDFSHLEVDCRNCLAVAKILANKKRKTDFSLFARTSVDTIHGSGSELDNTSHIFGSFLPSGILSNLSGEISLSGSSFSTGVFLFAGDSHWARGFPYYEKKIEGYTGRVTSILYQKYQPTSNPEVFYHRLFSGVDDVIVNFESGLASDADCPRTSKETQMWTDPKYLPWLRSLGISLVNVANNHSHDCGKALFEKSQTVFASGGITSFGYNQVAFRSIRGTDFAFIGIDTIESSFDLGAMTGQIRALTASGYIPIVNIHWGIEYTSSHTPRQEKIAHDLIDAGARLIVGHHPHVIQDTEIYRGIPIYYSLGNFLFDQPFPKTLKGLILGCEISRSATICTDSTIKRNQKDYSLSFEE